MQLASVQSSSSASIAGRRLVLAALLFNFALCVIHTRIALHAVTVAASGIELLILASGLLVVRHDITRSAITLAAFVVASVVGLKLLNPELDLKILHDLLVMYVFFELGLLSNRDDALRLLWLSIGVVLAIGLFELLLPERYGQFADIWSYYVDKGVLAQTTMNYSNTTSFISGDRGGSIGRTFLPSILGAHRVSSVFLEPVSMGNFAIIILAWCLSVRFPTARARMLMIAAGLSCVVLADSRLAAGTFVLMLAFRAVPMHRYRIVVFALPLFVMLALTIVGSIRELPGVIPSIMEDDFGGRLLFSGRLLNYWNLPQWLGLVGSSVYTADTGYAYVVNNLGLPLSLLMLGVFAFHVPATREAESMKGMIAVYMAASLCIGANMFTIKTAALCWFLYGVCHAVDRMPHLALFRTERFRSASEAAAWQGPRRLPAL